MHPELKAHPDYFQKDIIQNARQPLRLIDRTHRDGGSIAFLGSCVVIPRKLGPSLFC